MSEPLPCYEQLRDRVKSLDDALSAQCRVAAVVRSDRNRLFAVAEQAREFAITILGESNDTDHRAWAEKTLAMAVAALDGRTSEVTT